jgi:hypothetical protein
MTNIIEQQQQRITALETNRDADLAALCSGGFFTAAPQFPPTLMSRLITQTANTITLESIDGLRTQIEEVEGTGAVKVAGVQDVLDEFIGSKQTALEAVQEVVNKAKAKLADFEADERAQQKSRTGKLDLSMTRSEVEGELAAAREARNKIRSEISSMQAAKAQLQSQAGTIETEYEKNAKVEKEKLTTLEKDGAKALEAFQQTLFKQIIEQATLSQVNTRLGVADQKTTAEIAKEVAGRDLSEIKNSLTKDQQAELDATISALKEGKVGEQAIDSEALFEEINREVEKSVKGIFNNPNYKTISQDILNEFLSQPTFKGLQGKVDLKLVGNGAEAKWTVSAKDEVAVDAKAIEKLQGDLDTRLRTDDKLKAKTEGFTKLVNVAVEENQQSPTLWDKFINFINQIKQKLGFDVKLENKQEISSKQDRAAKRSVGKFTKDVLQKAGSSRSAAI